MSQNRVNSPNIVLQYLSTSSNSVFSTAVKIPNDDTIPQNTEGAEFLTLSITPTLSTSKLLIEFNAQMAISAEAANNMMYAIFQDTTVNALAAISVRQCKSNVLRYVMTSGTTSSTTFKIRVGTNNAASGTLYVNANSSGTRYLGGVSIGWLSITEYRA